MIEISTTDGVVSATSNALAEAMAELIAAERRATENDLIEAVSLELTSGADARPGRSTTAAA